MMAQCLQHRQLSVHVSWSSVFPWPCPGPPGREASRARPRTRACPLPRKHLLFPPPWLRGLPSALRCRDLLPCLQWLQAFWEGRGGCSCSACSSLHLPATRHQGVFFLLHCAWLPPTDTIRYLAKPWGGTKPPWVCGYQGLYSHKSLRSAFSSLFTLVVACSLPVCAVSTSICFR